VKEAVADDRWYSLRWQPCLLHCAGPGSLLMP
jgi:hypothetical protein